MRSKDSSTLLVRLLHRYKLEAKLMGDLLEEFAEETINELLPTLSAERRLRGLSPEERVKGLSPEERVKGLSPEERAALLAQLLKESSSPPPAADGGR
jgi:hypothetical protein